jgi:ectoine hydroxylase-related dioxygenase (phytanoyl-CoA dioxygenase family)
VNASVLPRVDGATASAADVAAAVLEHGVCVVERLVDEATCDAVLAELQPHLDAVRPGADDFEGRNTRRVGAILGRSPTGVGLVAHELVLDTVERVLGPDATTFQLHLTQAIAIGPGSPAQGLHRDQWCFDFHPFPTDMVVEVSTIWALTEFTEQTGATRVVPGSHRLAEVTATDEDALSAEMPRGSVVVYTGATVHGGGANRSGNTRVGLNVDYTLGWLRQEENQYLSVPIEVARELPERVQRLMGYSMGSYALGYVGDLRDPISVLRPDSGTTGFTAG